MHSMWRNRRTSTHSHLGGTFSVSEPCPSSGSRGHSVYPAGPVQSSILFQMLSDDNTRNTEIPESVYSLQTIPRSSTYPISQFGPPRPLLCRGSKFNLGTFGRDKVKRPRTTPALLDCNRYWSSPQRELMLFFTATATKIFRRYLTSATTSTSVDHIALSTIGKSNLVR